MIIMITEDTTPYIIRGIEWPKEDCDLPQVAKVDLPDSLVLAEPEDPHLPDMKGWTDEDIEDFYDDYELSDEAWEALDAKWDREIKLRLVGMFGVAPVSIGGFEPA